MPPAVQQSSRNSTTPSQQPTLIASPTQPTSSLAPGQQSHSCGNQPKRSPSAAFQNALAEFRKRLTGEELARFQNTTYPQFCSELHDLQKEQIRRREVMNLSRIEAFLEGMHQLGKTIEVFVNAVDMVAFIWGPIKFLLLVSTQLATEGKSQ
jgi:hypothetical protein